MSPHFTPSSHNRIPPNVAAAPSPSLGGQSAALLKSAPKNEVAISGALFAGLTVSVKAFVADCCGDDESFTSIVMLKFPVCDVFPEITPLAARLKLVGSAPEE